MSVRSTTKQLYTHVRISHAHMPTVIASGLYFQKDLAEGAVNMVLRCKWELRSLRCTVALVGQIVSCEMCFNNMIMWEYQEGHKFMTKVVFQRSLNETLLPKAMQQDPSWEVNTLSATQQILNLWYPEFSFPYWQKLAVWPYSVPDIASPLSPTYSLKIHFNNIFHLRLGLPRFVFSYSIPKKKLYIFLISPMPSIYWVF